MGPIDRAYNTHTTASRAATRRVEKRRGSRTPLYIALLSVLIAVLGGLLWLVGEN